MTASVRGIRAVGGRDGSRSLAGTKEYQVIYLVQSDDRRDGPNIVMSAFGIPNIGDIYVAGNDVDGACVVVNKTCDQVDAYEWEVPVTYSNDLETDPIGFTFQDNPLNKPVEISYGFQNRRILVPGRFNDPLGPPGDHGWQQGILAPNGELFDPQPEIDIAEPVLTIKKNVQLPNPSALLAIANCVNSDWYQGAEPRQLRIGGPQAIRQWHKTCGFYFELTNQLIFRWETWDVQVLNQGSYYWTNGKPTNVWSTTELPSVKNLPNGEGRIFNLTTDGRINTTSTPTFTRLRVFREIPFGSLNLL